MKLSGIIRQLEELSPPEFALSYDNVGLLCGRSERDVGCVFIALDATDEVIEDAVDSAADLLITHHPLIFHGIKRVSDGDFIGRRLVKLIENEMSYYAMHTNFDVMGMADAAADDLGLMDREVLEVTWDGSRRIGKDPKRSLLDELELTNEGVGRVGNLSREMTLLQCARLVKEAFRVDAVRIYGDPDFRLRRAAICPGSGGSVIEHALKKGAEVLITGDIGHHDGIDAVARGLAIIDAGHYGVEKLFIPYMRDFFKRQMPELEVLTAKDIPPFVTV